MPLNYLQIYRQMEAKIGGLRLHQARQEDALVRALAALQQAQQRREELLARIRREAEKDPNLRCAQPTREPLAGAYPPPPPPDPLVLLASDGSQIFPDHHRAVYFGLVNVALVLLTPQESAWFVDSYLMLEEDFRADPSALPDEAKVRLQRMVREHEFLARAVAHLYATPDPDLQQAGWPTLKKGTPLVAMVDGPLELWGIPEVVYRNQVARVTRAWGRIGEHGAALLGYVERPRADLVMNALALLFGEEDEAAGPPWPGVHDALLFARHLPPGHRSAVFAIHTSIAERYYREHRVHFFYLNIGEAEQPHIVRVEVPAWVAQDPALLDRVHGGLLQHLRAVERSRYPYILHQAHERAVVREQDRRDLERRLLHFLQGQGLPVNRISAKQHLKERHRRRGRR